MVRIHISVNRHTDDKFGTALDLSGADVRVLLTQEPGNVLTVVDRRMSAAPS
jgi:hypothetical protein